MSATLFPNEKRKGNDGNMYESVADKNGIYRWRKAKEGKKKVTKVTPRKMRKLRYYRTLCNNPAEEYLVGFSKSIVLVWIRRRETIDGFSTDEEYEEHKYFDKMIYELKNPIKVMVGESPLNSMTAFSGGDGERFDGNTFLVQASKNRYVFIGCGRVSSFTLAANEHLTTYLSMLGNSSAPYPYIETNKFLYLIEGYIKVDIDEYRAKTADHPDIDEPYDALWHRNKELKIKTRPFVMKKLAGS